MIDVKQNLFEKYTDKQTFSKIVNYKTLKHMWEHCAKEYADLDVIVDGQNYTYKQLDEDVAVYRGVLKKQGVNKGDRVGVIIQSSYDFAKVFFAIQTLGAVAVLMPVQLDEKTVYGVSIKFKTKVIVYSNQTEEKINFAKSLNVATVNCSEEAEKQPAVEVLPEDDSVIIFTGGTTGKSKGALLSHKAMMAGTINGCYGVKDVFNQRYFLVLPLTHVFGLIRNFLTSIYTGSVLYICHDLKNMFKEMAQFSPTVLILVPALAEMALNLTKQFSKNILGQNLKYIICGACFVPKHLIVEYNQMGIDLLAGYGLTESANLVSGNPESIRKPESVGLPYPNQQLKIVNGELWLKGDNMLTRYEGDEEENKNAFEDGWFKTGDLVKVDEEGYLYIVGRIKDVIVLDNGENVSPAEIEDKFCALDFVADAMVYEDFNQNKKQVLTLEVVLRLTSKVDKETVLHQINDINRALPSHMQVTNIIIRDKDFDRTPAMKKIRIKKTND